MLGKKIWLSDQPFWKKEVNNKKLVVQSFYGHQRCTFLRVFGFALDQNRYVFGFCGLIIWDWFIPFEFYCHFAKKWGIFLTLESLVKNDYCKRFHQLFTKLFHFADLIYRAFKVSIFEFTFINIVFWNLQSQEPPFYRKTFFWVDQKNGKPSIWVKNWWIIFS